MNNTIFSNAYFKGLGISNFVVLLGCMILDLGDFFGSSLGFGEMGLFSIVSCLMCIFCFILLRILEKYKIRNLFVIIGLYGLLGFLVPFFIWKSDFFSWKSEQIPHYVYISFICSSIFFYLVQQTKNTFIVSIAKILSAVTVSMATVVMVFLIMMYRFVS